MRKELINELSRKRLDAYIIDNVTPFAVICPGGAYHHDSTFLEGEPYAYELNRAGFSAFVLHYRIKEEALFPAPMDDLGIAVQYILNNCRDLGVLPTGYSVWGSSAGGHLAASFGTTKLGYRHYKLPAPSVIVLAYPVITMKDQGHELTRKQLLGDNPSDRLVEMTSIENLIDSNFPKTFVWNCKTDTTVPYENGAFLKAALDANQVECEYLCYDTGQHAIGLAKNSEAHGWIDKAICFWNKAIENS